MTGNQDRAAKIYTDIKADVLAVPPEFPPGPPQEWKTIVPQRTTDREYKRGRTTQSTKIFMTLIFLFFRY